MFSIQQHSGLLNRFWFSTAVVVISWLRIFCNEFSCDIRSIVIFETSSYMDYLCTNMKYFLTLGYPNLLCCICRILLLLAYFSTNAVRYLFLGDIARANAWHLFGLYHPTNTTCLSVGDRSQHFSCVHCRLPSI